MALVSDEGVVEQNSFPVDASRGLRTYLDPVARAIGEGAGVRETMPSPSYNLLLRYGTESGGDVVHLDLYRLEGPDELWELGWSQLGEEGEVVLIEWPERAMGSQPPSRARTQ